VRELLTAVMSTPAGVAIITAWVAFLGASVASFLCVVVERVPRGESVSGRSHCVCGRQLTAVENIPVVSWLVLRGRSRCCHTQIPAFYVLTEAAFALSWGLTVAVTGFSTVLAATVVGTVLVLLVVGRTRAKR
jgi:leader peptidase (prepilin peptidase)/N-methyltransferase